MDNFDFAGVAGPVIGVAVIVIVIIVARLAGKRTAQSVIVKEPSVKPTFTRSEGPAEYGANGDFEMTIEDVFSIRGRGTVVTGKVAQGSVRVGDTVQLVRTDGATASLKVTGVEMFRKSLDFAQAGDNVGLLIGDITRESVARGDILRKN